MFATIFAEKSLMSDAECFRSQGLVPSGQSLLLLANFPIEPRAAYLARFQVGELLCLGKDMENFKMIGLDYTAALNFDFVKGCLVLSISFWFHSI